MVFVWLCVLAIRHLGIDVANRRQAPSESCIVTSCVNWDETGEAGYWGWVDFNLIIEARDNKIKYELLGGVAEATWARLGGRRIGDMHRNL